MHREKAPSNLKKDLHEFNISLFSAVTSWLRKRGKVRAAHGTHQQHSSRPGRASRPRRAPSAGATPPPPQVLRPKLSEEQKQQLKECFGLMDADGSGAIDAEELDKAFKVRCGRRRRRAPASRGCSLLRLPPGITARRRRSLAAAAAGWVP
jgi:hypothetical protein